jgi:hypothetical protein
MKDALLIIVALLINCSFCLAQRSESPHSIEFRIGSKFINEKSKNSIRPDVIHHRNRLDGFSIALNKSEKGFDYGGRVGYLVRSTNHSCVLWPSVQDSIFQLGSTFFVDGPRCSHSHSATSQYFTMSLYASKVLYKNRGKRLSIGFVFSPMFRLSAKAISTPLQEGEVFFRSRLRIEPVVSWTSHSFFVEYKHKVGKKNYLGISTGFWSRSSKYDLLGGDLGISFVRSL